METDKPLIRIGHDRDGGYLVPDDLDGITACFSPGVGELASFEMDLVERGIPCFLADGSVDALPDQHARLHFTRKFVGCWNDQQEISLGRGAFAHPLIERGCLLQMDIEGGEWPVLLNLSRALLRRFRIIVAEFHNLDRLAEGWGHVIISTAIKRLLRFFHVTHIHPNNFRQPVTLDGIDYPPVCEFTFLRKDRVQWTEPAREFPHPLDHRNALRYPDPPLPQAWFAEPPEED